MENFTNEVFKQISFLYYMGVEIPISKTILFNENVVKLDCCQNFMICDYLDYERYDHNTDYKFNAIQLKTKNEKLLSLFNCDLHFGTGCYISIRYEKMLLGAHFTELKLKELEYTFVGFRSDLLLTETVFESSFKGFNIKTSFEGQGLILTLENITEQAYSEFFIIWYDIYRLLYILLGNIGEPTMVVDDAYTFFDNKLLKYKFTKIMGDTCIIETSSFADIKTLIENLKKIEEKTPYLLHWFFSTNDMKTLDMAVPIYVQCIEALYKNYHEKPDCQRTDISLINKEKIKILVGAIKAEDINTTHFEEYFESKINHLCINKNLLQGVYSQIRKLTATIKKEVENIVNNYGDIGIKNILYYYMTNDSGQIIFAREISEKIEGANSETNKAIDLINIFYYLRTALSHGNSSAPIMQVPKNKEYFFIEKLRLLIRTILIEQICGKSISESKLRGLVSNIDKRIIDSD